MTLMRCVFMGTPPYAAISLARLLDFDGCTIAAVVTRPDAPAGRGKKLQPSAVKTLALKHNLEVLEPRSAKDPAFAERLAKIAPDLGVVVAYGRILPNSVLEIPRHGCINAHGSILPALRGAAPIERAMLQGLDETGVTIIRINERMDAGDVMLEQTIPIGLRITGGQLRERMADMSAELLVQVITQLNNGTATFTPQNDALATPAPPLTKQDMRIDWTADAHAIDRQIRAFLPSPAAFTFLGGKRLKILAAHVIDESMLQLGNPTDSQAAAHAGPATDIAQSHGEIIDAGEAGLLVTCGEGLLRITRVQPEGKKQMAAADFVRGYGKHLPHRFEG